MIAARGVEPRCGLLVVDLRTGRPAHRLWVEGGGVEEVYDVAVLPGARRPAIMAPREGEASVAVVPGPAAEM